MTVFQHSWVGRGMDACNACKFQETVEGERKKRVKDYLDEEDWEKVEETRILGSQVGGVTKMKKWDEFRRKQLKKVVGRR